MSLFQIFNFKPKAVVALFVGRNGVFVSRHLVQAKVDTSKTTYPVTDKLAVAESETHEGGCCLIP